MMKLKREVQSQNSELQKFLQIEHQIGTQTQTHENR